MTLLLARAIACASKTKSPWDRASCSLASSSYKLTSTLFSRLLEHRSLTCVIQYFGIPYVLDNTPPPFFHTTLCPKWGGGLYSNMKLVSTISPTAVLTPYHTSTDTTKGHVYIRADVVHANYYVSESSLHKLSACSWGAYKRVKYTYVELWG